jgi:hypothetical protein
MDDSYTRLFTLDQDSLYGIILTANEEFEKITTSMAELKE